MYLSVDLFIAITQESPSEETSSAFHEGDHNHRSLSNEDAATTITPPTQNLMNTVALLLRSDQESSSISDVGSTNGGEVVSTLVVMSRLIEGSCASEIFKQFHGVSWNARSTAYYTCEFCNPFDYLLHHLSSKIRL